MQIQSRSIESQTNYSLRSLNLHKYVLICVGCFLMIIATFPLAYYRVSMSEKYGGEPFKSFSEEDAQKHTPSVKQE